MKRRIVTGLAIAAGALVAAPAGEARSLVLAIGGEPSEGFDPIRGWGDYGHPLFQSTLLRLDADLEVAGDLAADWTISGDGLEWTVRIRADARFSDGSPVTADDVAFTFRTASEAGGLVDLSMLADVQAPDPETVVFRLERPWITFTRQLTTLGIVPSAAYGDGYGRNPIGSGPFRLVEWQQGSQLVVAPNPHWHGGAPPWTRISFIFPGPDAALALAQAGDVHVVSVPPSFGRAAIPGMRLESIASVDNRGIMFPMIPDTGGRTEAGHPIGNDVTADIAIRRAVNLALNRHALVELALDGRGSPARGPVDGLPWDNPEAALPDDDPAAAISLLEEAGWTGAGIRSRGGIEARFSVIYPASDPTRQALALGVADQLAAVGIAAEPAGRSWDEIRTLMFAHPVVFGWGAHDPLEVWNLYHSTATGTGSFNPGHYANPAVDAHLEAAQAAASFEASLPHWQAAQWDGETGFGARGDAAWAWLVNIDHTYFVSDCLDLGPLQIQPHGHGFPITAGITGWSWTCAD